MKHTEVDDMAKKMGMLLLILLLTLGISAAWAEETLKPGDSGDAVLELNTRLRQLNYTTVRATNQYGTATETAVSAVQAAYGLEATGIADEKTLSIIYGDCYRPLSYGSEGLDVKLLQEKLVELGYYSGNVTGSYLEGTTTAVKVFQGENSMEITGDADVKTQEKLFSLAIRPTPTPSPVPTPGPAVTPGPYQPFERELRYGTTGADVQKVQQKLMDMGYFTYSKTTTGYYKNTQAAVEAFQKANGISVTGVVDEETWDLIFNAAYLGGEGEMVTFDDPESVESAAVIVTAPPTGNYVPFTKKLSRGDKSDDVKKVQERLKELGFFTFYTTTTNYGENTQKAVQAFQAHNSLKVTGTVDEKTWNAIFNDETTVSAYSAPKPDYVVPYFFEVDVKNQVVKVWKYNYSTQGYTDLDRCFLCTTGSTSNPSPVGTHTLSGRKATTCLFTKWGNTEARWWTKITEEIAFHSVIYGKANDSSTLKVSSLNNLGKRGSHGCIRLTVADAKWIYDNVEEGMQVWIHEDADADPELRYAIQPGALNKKTMMPEVTPEPPQYAYDGTQAPAEVSRSLNLGKEGQDVYWLQMKLKELGFYQGTVTGQYREGTQRAVASYQRSRGLSSDGNAGKSTLQTLYNEVREANKTPVPTQKPSPTPNAEPTSTPSPAPDFTVIDTETVIPETQTAQP